MLELLPSSEKIKALRVEYGRNNGTTMHEEILYGFKNTEDARLLFNALNKIQGTQRILNIGHGRALTHRQNNGFASQ